MSTAKLPKFAPEISEDSFVNLGARDGLADDPLQFLLRDPRHVEFALAVEMDPERPRALAGLGTVRCGKPIKTNGFLRNICLQMVGFPHM